MSCQKLNREQSKPPKKLYKCQKCNREQSKIPKEYDVHKSNSENYQQY